MDIERERAELQRYIEGHQRRVDHLRRQIDRYTRELYVHEIISSLATDSRLPEVMRTLSETIDAGSATSGTVRAFLADRGVLVPPEIDLSVQGGEDFVVTGTYPDDMFPAEMSWSSRGGFVGRIVNMWWRGAPQASAGEDS